ncbi:MAG: hypothetical protein ACOC5R_04355 [Elusimicrobiota bacterium]
MKKDKSKGCREIRDKVRNWLEEYFKFKIQEEKIVKRKINPAKT